MKYVAVALLLLGSMAHAQEKKDWDGYNKGITWEKSLDDAKQKAAESKKPILVHQLVGDLDKVGC